MKGTGSAAYKRRRKQGAARDRGWHTGRGRLKVLCMHFEVCTTWFVSVAPGITGASSSPFAPHCTTIQLSTDHPYFSSPPLLRHNSRARPHEHPPTHLSTQARYPHLSVPPNQRCRRERPVGLHQDLEWRANCVSPFRGVFHLEGVVACSRGVVHSLILAVSCVRYLVILLIFQCEPVDVT